MHHLLIVPLSLFIGKARVIVTSMLISFCRKLIQISIVLQLPILLNRMSNLLIKLWLALNVLTVRVIYHLLIFQLFLRPLIHFIIYIWNHDAVIISQSLARLVLQ